MAGSAPIFGRLGAALAVLALVFQLAVPPGFMVAATAGGPAVVICTGHGPALAAVGDHGAPAKSPDSKSGGVCAFAGHGGAPLAPATRVFVAVRFESFAPQAAPAFDLAPGRGLAAPPPPSQAPPSLLI